MAYIAGDDITTVEFNTFISQINQILGVGISGSIGESLGGYGYGSTVTTSAVEVGDLVTASNEWDQLLKDIDRISLHQTNTALYPAGVSTGDIVVALVDLENNISTLDTNKFTVSASQIQTGVTPQNVNSNRTTDWEGTITHSFSAAANSWDDLRVYFNAGGKILLELNYDPSSGSPTGANERFRDMINGIGLITFDYSDTTSAGTGTSYGSGFYDLSDSSLLIFRHNDAGESVEVRALLNDSPGSADGIVFNVIFSSTVDGDSIMGDLTSDVTRVRSINAIASADLTYTKLIDLTLGGSPADNLELALSPSVSPQACVIGSTCPVDFVVNANVSNALGAITYAWSIDNTTDFQIISSPTSGPTLTVAGGRSGSPGSYSTGVECDIIDNGRVVNNTASGATTISVTEGYDSDPIVIDSITQVGDGVIYNGTGSTANNITEGCTYDGNTGGTSCNVTYQFTAAVSGYESGSTTYLWQLVDNDSGSISITSSTNTNTVSILSSSGSSTNGSLRLTTTTTSGSDTVLINLNSTHSNSSGSLTVSLPASSTQTCTYSGSGSNCNVVFNLTATVSGGVTPYNYNWTSSNNSSYPVVGSNNTATVTTPSGRTNLNPAQITLTVTDNNGVEASDIITLTAIRRPTAISNVNIVGGNSGTCTYSRDSVPSSDFTNSSFCKEFTSYNATVTGGSGSYTYNWLLNNISPANKASFANSVNDSVDPGWTTDTGINTGVLTTNSGVSPNTGSRTNNIGYRLNLTVTDNQSNAPTPTNNTDSANASNAHNDNTTTVNITENITFSGGTCTILGGGCSATSTHTVSLLNGVPDSYLWEFVSNASNRYSFATNGSTSSASTSNPSIQINSVNGGTAGPEQTAQIRVTARKTGQPGDVSNTQSFNHTRESGNQVILPATYQVTHSVTFTGPGQQRQVRAALEVERSGIIESYQLTSLFQTFDWVTNKTSTVGNNFEYRVTNINYDPDGDATFQADFDGATTWTTLSLPRTIDYDALVASGVGQVAKVQFDLTIREITNQSNTGTCTVKFILLASD